MTPPALEQYYTVAEVAAALKVKDRTIREWIGNGKIRQSYSAGTTGFCKRD